MTPHEKMRGKISICPRKRAWKGFGIVSAIFLLVVLAGLGAAMANLSIMQHAGGAMDVQQARAYQAARAGIEWGLHRSLVGGDACPDSGTTTSFKLPASTTTLGGFTVTVTCVGTTYANATPPINVRNLTVVACNEPNGAACPGTVRTADYVERQLQATFQK